MKIELELIIDDDGENFINYWDYIHGYDVCCRIVNGKLIIMELDDIEREITFEDYINIIEQHIKINK